MLYEIRTYDLMAGSLAEVEKRFGERMPGRLAHSKLGGFWHTDVGPLNQIIHIWPYEDLNQRSDIRAQSTADGGWPPHVAEFIVNMQSEVYLPAPFMTPLGERAIGPLYEMRTYTYAPRAIPRVLEAWGEAIAAREELSPLAGCWYSDIGGLNRLVHLWAYSSFEERASVRAEAQAKGIWPARSGVSPLKMENKLLVPASFSPMQ